MPFLNAWHGHPVECGLVYFLEELQVAVPVPLKKVSLRARVVDFVGEVTVEQEYCNRESRPIEAVYSFPVEEEAAVVEFEAEVDGRTVSFISFIHSTFFF